MPLYGQVSGNIAQQPLFSDEIVGRIEDDCVALSPAVKKVSRPVAFDIVFCNIAAEFNIAKEF